MNTAAANITAPKMTICVVPGMNRASRTPSNVPSMATPPNTMAMRTLTLPARQWPSRAERAGGADHGEAHRNGLLGS